MPDTVLCPAGRSQQPLKSKNPYERFVAQHDNVIFFKKDGSKYSTDIDNIDTQKILSRFDSDIIITHGHPNLPNANVPNPITPNDCKYINSNNAFKEIIAYDQHGNFSKLVKKDSNNKLPQNFQQIFETDTTPQKLLQRLNELVENTKTYISNSAEEKEFIEISKELQKLSTTKQHAINIHKFWVNNDNKLGLEYSTNYPWLE